MDFFKPEMLQWTAAVIVPGFVAMRVYDLLVPAARRDWSKSILDLLVYGGINFALWFWWTDGLVSAGRAHRWWFGLAALGVLVFSPALLGALEEIRVEQKRWADALRKQAQQWQEAQVLRQFIDTVGLEIAKSFGEPEPGSPADEWIQKARAVVDQLDPVPGLLGQKPTDVDAE